MQKKSNPSCYPVPLKNRFCWMIKKRQETFVMAAPRRYGVRNRGDRSQAGRLLSFLNWNMDCNVTNAGLGYLEAGLDWPCNSTFWAVHLCLHCQAIGYWTVWTKIVPHLRGRKFSDRATFCEPWVRVPLERKLLHHYFDSFQASILQNIFPNLTRKIR